MEDGNCIDDKPDNPSNDRGLSLHDHDLSHHQITHEHCKVIALGWGYGAGYINATNSFGSRKLTRKPAPE
jgi:hypothetical protein